ncbi:hypothetical protein BH10ACI1_BH10ACI1_17230 [soil metagenome]
MKDRLKKKLQANKLKSQNKPKSILPFVPGVEKKEYELPAEYQQQLKILTQLIENRDNAVREMPNLPPDVRTKAIPALNNFNKQIENIEQALADEYNRYQAEKQRKANISDSIERGMKSIVELFIIMRREKPRLFKKFKKIVIQDMTPEEEQDFYDRVAIREAEIAKGI